MVQKNAASPPTKKLPDPVREEIRSKHYSLTMEKWARLHKASSALDRLT
jgi:hypothetical protein